MGRRPGRLRIGTSGYEYPHWRGDFYPPGLPAAARFAHYAQHFDALELNATFYRLPAPEVFERWRRAAPPDFRFAVKYSRFGSHMKRLRDPEIHLARFLDPVERLGRRLGPILVQLPPRWHADPARLDAFLAAAPRRRRWAVEVRDASWLCDAVYAVLRRHRAALVLHDLLPAHPLVLTAGWTYLRFHGTGYGGSYTPQALAARARVVGAWLARGIDVWAFFNNDLHGHAPRDAAALRRYVLRAAGAGRSAGSAQRGAGSGAGAGRRPPA